MTESLSAEGAGDVGSMADKLDFDDFLLLEPELGAADPDMFDAVAAAASTLNIPVFFSSVGL